MFIQNSIQLERDIFDLCTVCIPSYENKGDLKINLKEIETNVLYTMPFFRVLCEITQSVNEQLFKCFRYAFKKGFLKEINQLLKLTKSRAAAKGVPLLYINSSCKFQGSFFLHINILYINHLTQNLIFDNLKLDALIRQ